MKNENRVDVISETMNPDLVQLHAGNEAMFAIFKKYFSVIIGGIFAILVQKPEITKGLSFNGYKFSDIITTYVGAGIVGLFLGETRKQIVSMFGSDKLELPMWLKKLFVFYGMVGFLIFMWLFNRLIQ